MDREAEKSEQSRGSPTRLERGGEGYPAELERLSDPPAELFVHGRLPGESLVAVVGSRDADKSMLRFAEELSAGIVDCGLGVVSGGAHGVDTAAHRGALAAGGSTVVVLGSGFGHVYPAANRELFHAAIGKGAVLTEFERDCPPTRWTFPRRNRIVAALAEAVVVVQARERSGALITAARARELRLPLGAVPGSPLDPRSRGCNELIRRGAAVIESAADVLEAIGRRSPGDQLGLPGLESRGMESSPGPRGDLGDRDRAVLEKLGATPAHIDEIASWVGLSASEAQATMLNLELAGFVEDRGGKLFVRVG